MEVGILPGARSKKKPVRDGLKGRENVLLTNPRDERQVESAYSNFDHRNNISIFDQMVLSSSLAHAVKNDVHSGFHSRVS